MFSKSCCLYLYRKAVPVPAVSEDNCLAGICCHSCPYLLSFDQFLGDDAYVTPLSNLMQPQS